MRYVCRNLKNFVRKEPVIFFLTVLCVVASTTVLLFAFGLYHHMKQKEVDEKYGQHQIAIGFSDPTHQLATKGNVIAACKEIPNDILSQCWFYAEAHLPGSEEEEDAEMRYLTTLSLWYEIRNGTVTVDHLTQFMEEQTSMQGSGKWFTAEQMEQADQVCIAADPSVIAIYNTAEAEAYAKNYEPNEDGNYMVDGKEYTPIGYFALGGGVPEVPVTTVEDDRYVSNLTIEFETVVTRDQYNEVRQIFEKNFGDAVSVTELRTPDLDGAKFYRTLTLACCAMAALSGIVLAVLYEYILLQRKRQLTILRLCGLTLWRARAMYLAECLLICVASCAVSALLFFLCLMPKAQQAYEYIGQSYTRKSCGLLALLYIGITMLVLSAMLRLKLRKAIYGTYGV